MKHLGDITKINGAEIAPVDVIIGGSPCQDLSVAGKRAGLAGARSGLFMEQIRIVKEMRDATNGTRPRFMVWENVPGAFSSNKGGDFAAVLEETIRVVELEAPGVDVPERGWPTWGQYRDVGGRWSVAWRVLDAQYWGVPQRRRRIALIADFGGSAAGEILFNRKGVSRDSEPCGETRKEAAAATESGAGNPVWCLQGNGIDRSDTAGCNGRGWRENQSYTLNTVDRPAVACLTPWDSQSARIYDEGGVFHTLSAGETVGHFRDGVLCAYSFDSLASNSMKSPNPHSGCRKIDIAKTLDTSDARPDKNQGGMAILDMSHTNDVIRECGEIVPTLASRMGTGGNQVPLAYGVGNGQLNEAQCMATEKAQTLNTMHDAQAVMQNMVVRRLTPLECERLQGFQDGWTDIGDWTDSKGRTRRTSDSARYKAIGNSIALPPWKWVLKRLCAEYERDATMGSLFDGIGGFPLIWEQLNGRGSCLWASEIEEFCIAVTKRRFNHE